MTDKERLLYCLSEQARLCDGCATAAVGWPRVQRACKIGHLLVADGLAVRSIDRCAGCGAVRMTTSLSGGKQAHHTVPKAHPRLSKAPSRAGSDEAYVIDLCDEVLGEPALRQHTFDFLLGDPSPATGARRRLPVDAFYPSIRLVIEYREPQHSKPVRFFDKPDKMTVSGVARGEQRRIYDLRRLEVLPRHGIRVALVSFDMLVHSPSGRLRRDRQADTQSLRSLLSTFETHRRGR